MEERDHVRLDTLDGFEFEELCAEIFRRLGYEVRNVQATGDEGRDLILRDPKGETIVVECKHWSNATAGRPVVQKLHSALLTFGASQGMLIATGGYSKEALEYTKKVKEKIQLVDLAPLKDLAARAGITLVTAGSPMPVQSFPVSDAASLKRLIDGQLLTKLESHPAPPGELFTITQRSAALRAVFLMRYTVDQDFRTGVGVVHSLSVADGFLLVDAEDGSLLPQAIIAFLRGTPLVPLDKATGAVPSASMKGFTLGFSELRDVAKQHIVGLHRASVSYWGKNNQRYTLECAPSHKSIFLKDVRQAYLPEQSVELQAIRHTYALSLIEGGDRCYYLKEPAVYQCERCQRPVKRGLLCNACGAIAHAPRVLWWSHSFRCRTCKKTLCERCAVRIRRWVVFKISLCHECAATSPAPKRSTSRL